VVHQVALHRRRAKLQGGGAPPHLLAHAPKIQRGFDAQLNHAVPHHALALPPARLLQAQVLPEEQVLLELELYLIILNLM
jgi:hypothetical protein